MEGKDVSTPAREKIYHRLFEIGIWVKGFDGVVELFGGILLLIVSPHALNHYVMVLAQDGIAERHDILAHALHRMADNLSVDSKLIGAAYLLGNGIVKVFLAAGILRGKLWCYPTAIVVIAIFVCLQVIRLCFHFSHLMLAGIIIDTAIVLLIAHEYHRVRHKQP